MNSNRNLTHHSKSRSHHSTFLCLLILVALFGLGSSTSENIALSGDIGEVSQQRPEESSHSNHLRRRSQQNSYEEDDRRLQGGSGGGCVGCLIGGDPVYRCSVTFECCDPPPSAATATSSGSINISPRRVCSQQTLGKAQNVCEVSPNDQCGGAN